MTAMENNKKQDGWWYPWIFVGAFAVVFIVNGTMAFFAVDSWTGLETKNHFNEGTDYNTILDQRAKQEALGWTVKFTYEHVPTADEPRSGIFRLKFTDKDGRPVNNLYIDALAMRPTHEGYDEQMIFTYRGDGTYAATKALPLPGLWELRYQATRADELYKMRQRVQVQ